LDDEDIGPPQYVVVLVEHARQTIEKNRKKKKETKGDIDKILM